MFLGAVEAETLQRGLYSFSRSLLNKVHKQMDNHKRELDMLFQRFVQGILREETRLYFSLGNLEKPPEKQ